MVDLWQNVGGGWYWIGSDHTYGQCVRRAQANGRGLYRIDRAAVTVAEFEVVNRWETVPVWGQEIAPSSH
jgi:hypothetical protein